MTTSGNLIELIKGRMRRKPSWSSLGRHYFIPSRCFTFWMLKNFTELLSSHRLTIQLGKDLSLRAICFLRCSTRSKLAIRRILRHRYLRAWSFASSKRRRVFALVIIRSLVCFKQRSSMIFFVVCQLEGRVAERFPMRMSFFFIFVLVWVLFFPLFPLFPLSSS